MEHPVRLQLSEDGADAERLDTLTGHLRNELRELDVEVAGVPAGTAPPGTRALDPVAIGALLVTVGQSTLALRDVIATVRGWLSRGAGTRRTVKIEIDGDTLELSEVSAAEQDRLVELFVGRHTADREGR